MKRYIYILASIISFILFPNSIKASICPNSELVNLKSMAQNVSISYDYVEENENTTFKVTFTNIPQNFYIMDLVNKQVYNYTGSEMTIPNLPQGKKLKYGVYISQSYCDNILLYTHYVTLPYYNPYYNHELCKGISDFNYCNKWINKKFDFNQFTEVVTKYRDKLNRELEKNKEPEKISLFTIFIDFYLKYYYIILPVIIITGILVIRRYNKKQDLF